METTVSDKTHNSTNTKPYEMVQCTNCKHTQTIPKSPSNLNRVRRSNSCPSNDIQPLQKPTALLKQVTMIKKWHSLQTVNFKSNSDTLLTQQEQPNDIITHQSPSVDARIWAPFRKSYDVPTVSLSRRVLSLFAFGVALAILLNFLQKQKKVTVFAPGVFGDVFNSAWWIPPTFGIAAIIIGLLYPKIDEILGHADKRKPEWANVMRCVALFVGINHASAKIAFDSNIHLLITLSMLSIGLWYFFDQSMSGLGLGIATTGVATIVTQILVAMNVFGYSNPDFLYMQSWVPCLFFSGGVTVGAVGRALASFEDAAVTKQHME